MKNRKKYCNKTGKFSYPSEAAASRAKNKYDDIKRVYHCKSCSGWHSTSQTIKQTLDQSSLSLEEVKELEYKKLKKENNRLSNSLRRAKGEIKNLKHNIEKQKEALKKYKSLKDPVKDLERKGFKNFLKSTFSKN